MYIDFIKRFAKHEKELEILIQTLRIYNEVIGIEFGIEKMCHANNEKQKMT